MFESTCNGLCSLWKAVDYTVGVGSYASGYVGGSIPSVIAKGVEGFATGCYKVSQLFAHTDETGSRHGLLYHPVSQAAGVALTGFGISYAGYKLVKGQPLLIQRAWAAANGRHHIQVPPLSTFLRALAGGTMMVGGTLMVANTFYHGTWGVAPGHNPGNPLAECYKQLSKCTTNLNLKPECPKN